MTTPKVGIATYEDMKARTLAVARGERRIAPDEPRLWCTSMESFAKVLSANEPPAEWLTPQNRTTRRDRRRPAIRDFIVRG